MFSSADDPVTQDWKLKTLHEKQLYEAELKPAPGVTRYWVSDLGRVRSGQNPDVSDSAVIFFFLKTTH